MAARRIQMRAPLRKRSSRAIGATNAAHAPAQPHVRDGGYVGRTKINITRDFQRFAR